MAEKKVKRLASRVVGLGRRWRYHLNYLENYYLRKIAIDIGALNGRSDYVKFIILGAGRTGSTFLKGLLNSHSRIVCFSEIFQKKSQINWGLPGFLKSGGKLALHRDNPVGFLNDHIFCRQPSNIAAVGFKMFYYHAPNSWGEPIWSFLKEREDIRIIHIKRKNILKTHLSLKRAEMTDVWVKKTKKDAEEAPFTITLDYGECLDSFINIREFEKNYDAFFRSHPKIEVFYEDLAKRREPVMRRVQDFLCIRREPTKPDTVKQSTRPISRIVSNYPALKERFKGTEWESFFVE